MQTKTTYGARKFGVICNTSPTTKISWGYWTAASRNSILFADVMDKQEDLSVASGFLHNENPKKALLLMRHTTLLAIANVGMVLQPEYHGGLVSATNSMLITRVGNVTPLEFRGASFIALRRDFSRASCKAGIKAFKF